MPVRQIDDSAVELGDKMLGWTSADWGIDGGRFGRAVHVAHLGDDGTFQFDRVMIEEGPHAIAVAYGVPKDGVPRLLLVKERRDGVAPLDGQSSAWFWGPPRGFAEPSDIAAGAAAAVAKKIAARETAEEGGFQVIEKSVEVLPPMYVNETCVRTSSPLALVEVDMGDWVGIRHDDQSGERIATSDFFTIDEVERMIAVGEHDGACTTSGVLMSAVMMFRIHVLPKFARMAHKETV